MSLTLVQTCGACPEQYDVSNEAGEKVGYLRLRGGYFYALHDEKTVFDAYPDGDGIFASYERDGYLAQALAAIQRSIDDEAIKKAEGKTT